MFGDRHRDFPVTKAILTCDETNRSYSWGDIRSGSIEFGKGLMEVWGWKKGDVLAFYTPNNIDVCDTSPPRLIMAGHPNNTNLRLPSSPLALSGPAASSPRPTPSTLSMN